MPRRPIPLPLTDADRQKLERWLAAYSTPQQVALRCRIVLAAAEGQSDLMIARMLSINRHTCRL
jgi:hypothetical protein